MIPAIREFLKKQHSAANIDQLTDNDSLLLAGVIDSALMIELVVFLEQQFQLVISDDELTPENFESLAAIERFLKSRVGTVT